MASQPDAVVSDLARLPRAVPSGGSPALGSIRLVLVDDDDVVRQALRDLLADAGYHVVGEAGNGVDGLAVIIEARPHVVLLDLRMPGLGGVDLARRLRRLVPDIRVIMFSAHDDAGLQSMLTELGVVAYLIKGCPYRKIVAAIEAALADVRGTR